MNPSSDRRDRIVEFLRVVPIANPAAECPGLSTSTRTSQLTAGTFATAAAGATSVNVSLTRGFAKLGELCDVEVCDIVSLDSLRADVANMTIAGAQITNAVVTLGPAAPLTLIPDPDGGGSGFAAHSLKFLVQGKVNGGDEIYRAENDRPWRLDTTGGNFRLTGSLTFLATDATGRLLPVNVNADVRGTPATPQNEQCANFTSLQRLFGFEDVQDWTSSQANLLLVTNPVTQGCGALGVQGQGYMPIKGGTFVTAGLPVSAALSTDLFIPNNQPNQSWLGALQMYLSCPSGNVFNQYIGQVELTGKPQNAFSTLRFPLPTDVRNTLLRNLNDCFFSYALNVNQTNRTWILDNLRFTP
jgi:hypothetical protein